MANGSFTCARTYRYAHAADRSRVAAIAAIGMIVDQSTPITYLTSGTRTAIVKGFTLMDGWFPAGLRIPSHYHEGATLAVILQGSFEERLRVRTYDCRQGLFVVKPPGETHRDAFTARGRAIAIEISPPHLAEFGPFTPQDATYVEHGEAHELGCRIARELREPPTPTSSLALQGLALELVAASTRRREAPGRVGPVWLRRLVEHLNDDPRAMATITAMAQFAGVHPVYLARVFKTYYRESLGIYARRLRLVWAADRLATTKECVAVIAHEAGFYDQSRFCRAFSKALGFTPSRYRQLFAASRTADRPAPR